jgi:hypothetical protein
MLYGRVKFAILLTRFVSWARFIRYAFWSIFIRQLLMLPCYPSLCLTGFLFPSLLVKKNKISHCLSACYLSCSYHAINFIAPIIYTKSFCFVPLFFRSYFFLSTLFTSILNLSAVLLCYDTTCSL